MRHPNGGSVGGTVTGLAIDTTSRAYQKLPLSATPSSSTAAAPR
jgi:hypothetical protein